MGFKNSHMVAASMKMKKDLKDKLEEEGEADSSPAEEMAEDGSSYKKASKTMVSEKEKKVRKQALAGLKNGKK